jgi:hypothetical protein
MRRRLAWAPMGMVLALSATAWGVQYDSDRVVMPAGSVLKVKLDETISSDRNKQGDRFTATVEDDQAGYDVPQGTRVEGVVKEVRRAAKDRPGMLDVDFTAMRLPDGQRYRVAGSAISLDERSVQRDDDGRLVAKSTSKKNRTKFIAYGAGAGFLISTLTGGGSLKGALIGAAGGLLLGELSKSKANGREVVLRPGTEFGVRLDQRLAMASTQDGIQGRATPVQRRY